MSNVPEELLYTKTHEWVRQNEDGTVTVGITDHAQDLLGDMVYVELPEPGNSLAVGDECMVVESVKAASDIYCPLSGEVVEVNIALADTPELINQDPYGEGWLFTLQPAEGGEREELMEADAYQELIESES